MTVPDGNIGRAWSTRPGLLSGATGARYASTARMSASAVAERQHELSENLAVRQAGDGQGQVGRPQDGGQPATELEDVRRELIGEVGEAGAHMESVEHPVLGAGARVELRIERDALAEPIVDVARHGQLVENVVGCPYPSRWA